MTFAQLFQSIAEIGPALANHIWQSTFFASLIGLLTLALRKNHARARHWLWLAASVKFLVPFSLLMTVGSQVHWRAERSAVQPSFSVALQAISQPFVHGNPEPPPWSHYSQNRSASIMPGVILTIWLGGCAPVLLLWAMRWRRLNAVARRSVALNEGREQEMLSRLQSLARVTRPIQLRSSSSTIEPGIFGISRPVLLLPAGISDRLTDEQLEAILAHELSHVSRGDNLAAAIHMLVEAIFWFHPLVWWMGSRLVEERERACDEEVLRLGNAPQAYAEGILTVCKFYLESPLACAAGVTGSDLKKRIEGIMNHRITYNLDFGRKLLVYTLGIGALAGPIALGLMNAPQGRAQSATAADAPKSFDVASIKPSKTDDRRAAFQIMPGGRISLKNIPVRMLIQQAYNVRDFQVNGGPSWMSDRFDIIAKAEGDADVSQEQLRTMMQALLADRFQLKLHHETKELPIYALVIGKNGIKMRESAGDPQQRRMIRMGRGSVNGQQMSMDMLAMQLSNQLGRTVIDKTGLKGGYDITLEWTPDQAVSVAGPGDGGGENHPASDTGPSLFTALQEQLGLKLESQKGPVDILVIDRLERPSEN